MRIKLSDQRQRDLIHRVQGLYRDRFDEEIGELKARLIVDILLRSAGPAIYNQGVRDAQAFVQDKLLDLEVEIYEPEDGGPEALPEG
jgi:uncharacterized protein (DUF2164 family)